MFCLLIICALVLDFAGVTALDINGMIADLQKGGYVVCQYCSYCAYSQFCGPSCTGPECAICQYNYHCNSTCQGLCTTPLCANNGPCNTNETCIETTDQQVNCVCKQNFVCPVDPKCEQKGRNGSCDFYQCFDNRMTCGVQGYALQYGLRYCTKFDNYYGAFTQDGQRMIDCVRKCLSSGLLGIYTMNDLTTIGCDYIETQAFNSHVGCYESCGFCQVFGHNKDALTSVFDARDPITRKGITQLVKVAARCAASLKDIEQWGLNLLNATVSPFPVG